MYDIIKLGNKEVIGKCANTHDLCFLGGPCIYCEPVLPLRGPDGRFIKLESVYEKRDC